MTGSRRVLLLALLAIITTAPAAVTAQDGQVIVGTHVTVAPKSLDPADTESAISPFLVLYPLHDAVVKLMPDGMKPSLAESWTTSPDGIAYDFVLRSNAKFHNGDPVTAEDVRFSFDRFRGGGAKLMKSKVKAV